MTEIVLFDKQGVTRVGPLPAPLQNETTYAAAPLRRASARAREIEAAVQALLAHRVAHALFRVGMTLTLPSGGSGITSTPKRIARYVPPQKR